MNIKRDKAYEKKLLGQIEKKYLEEERAPDNKWHVSDVVFARKTVACKFFGCPLRSEDVGFFFLGKSVHSEMQRILGIDKAEVRKEKYGVIGTMDWVGKDALEIKSSRKWTVPDHVESRYIQQAGYYAIVHDLNVILIPIVYPTAGRTWSGKKSSTVDTRVWRLTFTAADKKEILYDMRRTIEEMEQVIKTKDLDFKGLPPAPAWILERFGSLVPTMDHFGDDKIYESHPFWYAWKEHGKL